MQHLKEQKINGILAGYGNPLARGKEKNDPHPQENWPPSLYKFHFSSIHEFRFFQIKTTDKIPLPIPTNKREMISGLVDDFVSVADTLAGAG